MITEGASLLYTSDDLLPGMSINQNSGIVTWYGMAQSEDEVVNVNLKITLNGKVKNVQATALRVADEIDYYTYGAVTVHGSNKSVNYAQNQVDLSQQITYSQLRTTHFVSGRTYVDTITSGADVTFQAISGEDYCQIIGEECTVFENKSTSQRQMIIKVTVVLNEQQSIQQFTITQSAGSKTYSEIYGSISYNMADPSGGTVPPVLSYTQTWGWNGVTSGGGQ